MTRLEQWVERVTREMQRAAFDEFHTGGTANSSTAAARAVLEREVRAELLVHFSPADLRWLDENNS